MFFISPRQVRPDIIYPLIRSDWLKSDFDSLQPPVNSMTYGRPITPTTRNTSLSFYKLKTQRVLPRLLSNSTSRPNAKTSLVVLARLVQPSRLHPPPLSFASCRQVWAIVNLVGKLELSRRFGTCKILFVYHVSSVHFIASSLYHMHHQLSNIRLSTFYTKPICVPVRWCVYLSASQEPLSFTAMALSHLVHARWLLIIRINHHVDNDSWVLRRRQIIHVEERF